MPLRLALPFALLAFGVAAQAASALPPRARVEIEGLLSTLAQSNCEFNRNGSWHGATEASAHLRKKYEYLDGKDKLGSAETFIALAASQSSQTGKQYLVRCGQAAPLPSAEWLGNQLEKARRTSAAAPSKP